MEVIKAEKRVYLSGSSVCCRYINYGYSRHIVSMGVYLSNLGRGTGTNLFTD